MFEANIIRVAVLLYVGMGGFVAYLLWKNPAASNSLPNAGIVLAGLLPAFIAVLPYLKTNEISHKYNLVLFFDEEAKRITQAGLFSPYLRAYGSLYATENQNDLISREIGDEEVQKGTAKQYWPVFHKEKGLDLIESLVIKLFVRKFHTYWDMEYESKHTPTNNVSTGSPVTNKSSKTVKTALLNKMLRHNQLFQGRLVSFQRQSFEIPPDSEFSVIGSKNSRVISIKVPNVDGLVTISILPSHSGTAHGGVWGTFKPNNRLAVLEYETVVTLSYRPNAVDSKVIKRWFNNIKAEIAKLDWETIDSEVERELMRMMLEKQVQGNG